MSLFKCKRSRAVALTLKTAGGFDRRGDGASSAHPQKLAGSFVNATRRSSRPLLQGRVPHPNFLRRCVGQLSPDTCFPVTSDLSLGASSWNIYSNSRGNTLRENLDYMSKMLWAETFSMWHRWFKVSDTWVIVGCGETMVRRWLDAWLQCQALNRTMLFIFSFLVLTLR